MKRRRGGDDAGFTLIELILVVAVLGIVMVPLANFLMGYLGTYQTTESRLAYSHDIQIASAYFSQDVGDTGVHTVSGAPPYPFVQSTWTSNFPASYCANGQGTTVLLLQWDATILGSQYGQTVSSAAYVKMSDGTLHRFYCDTGTSEKSDATLVHEFHSVTVSCSSNCNGSTPPATITLSLDVPSGSADSAAPTQAVTITGQRRQT